MTHVVLIISAAHYAFFMTVGGSINAGMVRWIRATRGVRDPSWGAGGKGPFVRGTMTRGWRADRRTGTRRRGGTSRFVMLMVR